MTARARLWPTGIALLLVLVACGSDGTATPEAASESTPLGTDAAETPSMAAPSEDAAAPEEPAQDASEIDWATVDLTTIDWATIDMSQVDLAALADNPTFPDLDPEALEVISSGTDPGSATLTIGDRTWEFDSFVCAFGHEATQSETYSFTTNSFGEHEGARTQMQATIRPAGEDMFGVDRPELHRINFDDVSDFENPSIDWDMSSPGGIRIDGNNVTAEGMFEDQLTEIPREEAPGTLEATCGDGSRR